MRTNPLLCLALAISPMSAFAQRPCTVSGSPIAYYSVAPAPRAFTSILANPSHVVLPFPACGENSATTALEAIPLPFPFSFFGTPMTHVAVCVNGFLELNTRATAGRTADDNQVFPLSALPNGVVAPFWDDLKMGPAGDPSTVAYLATPFALTIEWSNMKVSPSTSGGAPGAGGSLTFQAVLGFSGEIELRYGTFTPPSADACPPFVSDGCATATIPQAGLSATIGLEDLNGTIGLHADDLGGAARAFPRCNYRFTPATIRRVTLGPYAIAATGTGFASIEGQSGTTAIRAGAGLNAVTTCPTCHDDSGSARTPVHGGNAALGSVELPWTFRLFDTAARVVNLDPNGLLVLNDPEVSRNVSNNEANSTTTPGLYIAPFWDDLEGTSSSFLGYRFAGTPGARTATFEWKNFGLHVGAAGDCIAAGAGRVSMQVVLSEGTDAIEFRYDQSGFQPGAFTATAAAIKNPNGTEFTTPFLGTSNTMIPFTNLRMTPPCDCGLVRFFGSGCPGSGGITPRLGTTGVPPQLGTNSFGLTLRDAAGGAPLVLALSPGPAQPGGIPLIGSCSLWVGLDPNLTFLNLGSASAGGAGAGTFVQRFAIPFDPTFLCAALSAQWLIVDGGASGGPLAATEGAKFALTL